MEDFFGEKTTLTEIKRIISNLENATYHIQEVESFNYEYTCSALVNTKLGN